MTVSGSLFVVGGKDGRNADRILIDRFVALCGGSSARVLVDIVLRLTSRSFAAGWLVTAVIAAGSLDVPLMLLPSTRPNVAVLVYTHIISGVPTQASALLVLLLVAIIGVALLYVALSGLVGFLSRLRVRSAYRAA